VRSSNSGNGISYKVSRYMLLSALGVTIACTGFELCTFFASDSFGVCKSPVGFVKPFIYVFHKLYHHPIDRRHLIEVLFRNCAVTVFTGRY
jgi:hypothetical protein